MIQRPLERPLPHPLCIQPQHQQHQAAVLLIQQQGEQDHLERRPVVRNQRVRYFHQKTGRTY
jgi:hypothetical protein